MKSFLGGFAVACALLASWSWLSAAPESAGANDVVVVDINPRATGSGIAGALKDYAARGYRVAAYWDYKVVLQRGR